MKKEKIHTKKWLKERRKELRCNLTQSEAFLWKQIKARKLEGKRFTKQHSIGNYIVDFYCAAERLIIELDGEVHMNSSAEEYDKQRTQYFENLNYKVLRFENKMVFENFQSVIIEIKEHFNS